MDDERDTEASKQAPQLSAATVKGLFGDFSVYRDRHEQSLVRVHFKLAPTPVGLAFNVSLQALDKSWPVGAIACAEKRFDYFSMETYLPTGIDKVNLVLTPSSVAATVANKLKTSRSVPSGKTWTGEAIVVGGIAVKDVDISVPRIRPPTLPEATEYAAAQLKRSLADTTALIAAKETAKSLIAERLGLPKTHSLVLYQTGCVEMARGDLADAIKSFQAAKRTRSKPVQDRDIEKQLRRICGIYLYRAKKNDSKASFKLGMLYQGGVYFKRDLAEAKRNLRNAANAGHARAMLSLAVIYEQREGREVGSAEAEQWYRAQADFWLAKASALDSTVARELEFRKQQSKHPMFGVQTNDYQQWIGRYQGFSESPLRQTEVDAETEKLPGDAKMIVTTVAGESPYPRSFMGNSTTSIQWTTLSASGGVSSFSQNQRGTKGAGSEAPDAPPDWKGLDELLRKLPDDNRILPPPGRRCLFQAMLDGRRLIRVYDRANFPAALLEVFKLSQCGVAAWMPKFDPDRKIKVRSSSSGGFVMLTPNHQQIVSNFVTPIQVRDVVTHEFVAEFHGPGNEHHVHFWDNLIFSPDGKQAVISCSIAVAVVETETWQIVKMLVDGPIGGVRYNTFTSEFSEDGKFFNLWRCGQNLSTDAKRLRRQSFDVKSWNEVKPLPDDIEQPNQFVPSRSHAMSVGVDSSGALTLRGTQTDRKLPSANQGVEKLIAAAFSPDDSLVAVAVRFHPLKPRQRRREQIFIWNTDTGDLVHELEPREGVEALAWSPHSGYLLVARAHAVMSNRSVYAFSIASGRFRGEFTGSLLSVLGMEVLPDRDELMVGSGDGGIRFWDLKAAVERMNRLEHSLSRPSPR